ncbi:MAG: metal-sensitive transcriptional regulator [Candidatus Aerophobetes bacterium]
MINEDVKKEALPRLKKIEGQIRGIQKMIEKERYCIDIINQVTAAQRALDQVGLRIMKRHIESCVTDAIKSDGGGPMIGELMETIYGFIR